jgi:alkanesulfonate monooxygenase SsuD/methylene tetrahydromethanopterin reductase-like flavin-dependent oxidoreductase (luciferase family)
MAVARGFGIAGALADEIAVELAIAAESAGYQSFWANDTPSGDGLATLAAVAKRTSTIGLGVGVIPIDRIPAERIAERTHDLNLPEDRLIVGIGSGGLTSGAVAAVESAARLLDAKLTAKVVVGSLGPRMCEVGGRSSDGVLLNWLTPSYLPLLADRARNEAKNAGRQNPWIAAYVRVALAGPAQRRLIEESDRYASYPQYAAHFDRMKVQAIETSSSGTPKEIQAGLNAYPDDADEIVVRAISADETLDAYLELLHAAAPMSIRSR